MAFHEIPSSRSTPQRETEILNQWRELDLFRKHVKQNQSGPLFVFYEGPPTANGRPGIHHVLSRVFKDVYIRYHGQKGAHIPRMAGWDCHGLPVEREVEKELGITTKSEIEEKYGLEEFNRLCHDSVKKYVGEWRDFSERLGFFIDLDNAYQTMDNSYIESVWALLKIIHERGLIYQGYRVVPFDPVMGATMSDAEVALGYRTVDDPSVTVRFALTDDKFGKNAYFLVWTTTPWTLPSNVALAVHPDEEYVIVRHEAETGEERLICARALMDSLKGDEEFEIEKTCKGSDLVGTPYVPLFDWMKIEKEKVSHRVFDAGFVTMDTGTGIVHIAPAYGADDLEVGQKNGLPIIHAVGLDGKFIEGTPLAGTFFKDADPQILKELKVRGHVWKSERYKHEYPFGWRTGAPLIYYAKDAWYIRTTSVREELISNNATINWVPDFIKEGRFGNWLANNRDWALSRERYWGTPLPVWSDGEGNHRFVGSLAELEKLSGKKLKNLDLHRPYIDRIEFKDPDTGNVMRRVPEVCDAWLDSGSMPYAQWGYPVKGEKQFQKYFPADFICEAVDQTRGWFYTLLAVSTMVSGQSSYKNVVCLGHVLDEKGEKMSKSKGNVVPPKAVFDSHGADAIRWYFLTGAPPGNSRRLGMPGVPGDPLVAVQGFFNMIINSVNFFVMYANVDGIEINGDWTEHPIPDAPIFKERPDIDRWVLSSLQVLIEKVTVALDHYDSQSAGRRIEAFVDSLSNWYIRRNRRRFWKGELDGDKLAAYDTLYRALVGVARLMVPFTPFLAESVYRSLVLGQAKGKIPESIHLSRWPMPDLKGLYDESILLEGDLVQAAASLGRTARMQSGMKVRQPLSTLWIHVPGERERKAIERNSSVLTEELNVKNIEFLDETAGILDYRIKPNLPRLGKRLGARMREFQEYLKTTDTMALAKNIRSGKTIHVSLKDVALELEAEDFLLESISREGTWGVEGDGMLVALDTKLTPELVHEGIARDIVRNIQELRKKSGLEITDRISLQLASKGEPIQKAIQEFVSYIEGETLAVLVIDGHSPAGKPAGEMEMQLEEHKANVKIWKT